MQESTYSSLSEPLFEQLKGPNVEKDNLAKDIKTFELFLESLGLQYEARQADLIAVNEQSQFYENEISKLDQEFEQKKQEFESLKTEAEKNRNISDLAHQRFMLPVDIELENSSVAVRLDKSTSQIDEDHYFLEEQLHELEEKLTSTISEFKRRSEIVNSMHEFLEDNLIKLSTSDRSNNMHEHTMTPIGNHSGGKSTENSNSDSRSEY